LEELEEAINRRLEGEDTGGSESDDENIDDPKDMDVGRNEQEIIGKSVC
jgi:hypothetical protein